VKIRELLSKINNALRPAHVKGEGEGPDQNLADEYLSATGPAPTNWVPSQQDERPKY
jgi:hypothetical protein